MEIECPACKGRRVLLAVGIVYAPGFDGPPVAELPCNVCNQTGKITEERLERIELGRLFRYYRVRKLGLGLREAAVKWGMKASELSRIEQGLVETDWVPPGFEGGRDADAQ